MTAYVLKFVSILKGRSETTELTIEALSEAERRWIIDSQSTQKVDLKFPTWKIQFLSFGRQPSVEMWWKVAKCQHLVLFQTPDTP